MIQPHGHSELTARYIRDDVLRAEKLKHAETLPSVLLSSAGAANAVMIGGGYFTPLTGYMNKADCLSVADTLHTTDGLFWPTPVMCLVDACDIKQGAIALRDPNVAGNPVIAIMDLSGNETLSKQDKERIATQVFATNDQNHPGVAALFAEGNVLLSGDIDVLSFSYFATDFPDTFVTAYQLREQIQQLGWQTVVAFQTRNPMHRAHEELCTMAMDRLKADGLIIHMLLGKLKPGDIPADVRDNAIRTMVEHYLPKNAAIVSGYGFDMLYAGPREAVLHAIFRQNMGATHLIVGRDHAGVGDFYGAFDAQTIFHTQVPENALAIKIFEADHTAYSKKLHRVVMMREVPDHQADDFVLLSGTKVREMLGQGIAPPPEFSRPEVAKILIDYYESLS